MQHSTYLDHSSAQPPVLTEAERELVLFTFNDTLAAYPEELLIQELFECQVRRTPESVAVMCERRSLTYSELNGRANQLARYLRCQGVGPDLLVGVYLNRGLEMVVSLLAVLKAGGAYLPLDPDYPSQRISYILEDAAPLVLLTQARLRRTILSSGANVILLDDDWAAISELEATNLDPRSLQLTPRHLAYVIYTSGSTGEPKGVAAEHRGMVNRIAAQASIAPFSNDDVCCHKTSVGFVDAAFELFGPLANGLRTVIASTAEMRDVQQLASLISKEQVTRLVTVPSLAQSILDSVRSTQSLSTVRSWTLSGEELRGALLRSLQKALPHCRFINLYGSSEVAADATFYAGESFEGDRVPIGRPLPNTRIYIVDRNMQPVAIGAEGEICVGGVGVARGYLDLPVLTAERFIADPFADSSGARLYRTGDRARWRSDGLLEFRGRADQQVKIRGFRIELGEIEAQLVEHSQVKEAVVVAREGETGEKCLVAYVVCDHGAAADAHSGPYQRRELGKSWEVDPTGPLESLFCQDLLPKLRVYLKERLPEYMVPSTWIEMRQLPLTPNGKVDRRALPAPQGRSQEMPVYVPPRTPREQTLADIWAQVLRVDKVGLHDNFFEMGGHSLLIVQMIKQLRRGGLIAEVRDIYESPMLEDLARTLTPETESEVEIPASRIPPACDAITPDMLPLVDLTSEQIEGIVRAIPGGAANIQDIYPLAPLQEGILFHHLLDDRETDTYVLSTLLAVSSRDRLEELIAALQAVIDRHDILRTAVLWEHLPCPVEVVQRQATLPVHQVSLEWDIDSREQIEAALRSQSRRIDLRQAPLMRLQFAADLHSEKWYALIQTHHLVCDNESIEVLHSEVVAHLTGQVEQLPEPVPYRNHVAHTLTRARKCDVEAFFRNKLSDLDETSAPFGILDVHGNGDRIEEACQTIDPSMTASIRHQSRRMMVSPATLFHAAWALVIAHTSARHDVVFGSVLLGRMQGNAGAERILGMFINTLPLRLRLGNVTARDLVVETQRELTELVLHEQASLAVAQRCSGVAGSLPLFTSLFNFRHNVRNAEADLASAMGIEVLGGSQERTNYPITISVDDLGAGFRVTAQTDKRIDPRRIAGYLCAATQSLVSALEYAPTTDALTLSILPDAERRQVIELFNAAPATFPQEKPIQRLFEEQVEKTPEAIAVLYEGQSLTYALLNARANQLAWHLISNGVGPEQLVGICVERGLDMVVALLGILKAGGAYLPLDPNYPSERLAYMVKDAAPKVILIQGALRETFPSGDALVIEIDDGWSEISGQSERNPDFTALGLRPDNLAYVIYTSGSTGAPKGVMVAHRNVTRLLAATEEWFGFNCADVWTVFHSLAFDFSVWELWGALLYGGRAILVPYITARSPQEFYRLVCEQHVTVLSQTPSAFAQLIDAQRHSTTGSHSLRVVIFGGEALDFRTLHPWVERNGADSPHLVNMYGITETTVHVTYRRLTAGEIASECGCLIGKPIPDLRVYLLNDRRQPVPIGVMGEIYVSGAGVARGYLNRVELTRERFIPDPFDGSPHTRMYKSGDLARWRPDGTIEYLGRNDKQVKIRGFRIEPGEIETQLVLHPLIKEALVIPRDDRPGDNYLVAYVIPNGRDGLEPGDATTGSCTEASLSAEALRAYLKNLLPEYMVPSAFITLDSFPLTHNGKLDRHALPAPELGAYASPQYVAPRGAAEEALAGIWQELLHVGKVGRDDNFFDLGGHSLLAMQLIVRLRTLFSVDVRIRRLFEVTTLKELAREVDELRDVSFLNQLESGSGDIQRLVERLSGMPESQATLLMRELEKRETL